jgi:hypothetical protein
VPPPPRTAVPALAAVAGVVVAHAVDYVVVYPEANERAAQLHATGHTYWSVAVVAAVAAAVVAMLVAAWWGGRRARGAPRARSEVTSLAWVLAWQVAAFAVMEAGERATAGLSPSALLSSRAFWFGLVLQLPVAWLATRLLRATEYVAFRLLSRLRPPAWSFVRHLPAPRRVAPLTAAVAARPRPRAPPLAPRF